jgi:hypothetical protein
MARKLFYKVLDNGKNAITESEWEEIQRVQHWYNSEFLWTAGRLALKMYAVFPNIDAVTTKEDELWKQIYQRRAELKNVGTTENEIIRQLEREGLVIAKKGGYFDECLASGFTRVAGNEFNAYLVSEFLLKVSLIARNTTIYVYDEGEFIKSKEIHLHQGNVILNIPDESKIGYFKGMVENRHVFAVVDAAKYDQFPHFQTTICDFNAKTEDERSDILKDWNWLGFENSYDINGDDIQGFDLNKKAATFELRGLKDNP